MTPIEPLYSSHPTALSRMMRVEKISSQLHVPSNSFNENTILEPDYLETSKTYHDHGVVVVTALSVTMAVFMIFAVVGNTLVILTVLRHKGMRTRTNMFIINLAVADILVSLFNMPFSLITVIYGDWIFGDVFCQFNGFVVPLFFIVSIHTLIYISIHKYISITRPFSHTMTPRKIMIMIAATWLWGIICATATLKGGNHVVYKKGASQCGPSIPDKLNEYIHSLLITTCNYIVPLVVMSSCYYNIFREIHHHLIRIRQTSNVDLQNSLHQQRRITFTLFLVLACFVICWTPFIWYSCAAAFSKDKGKIPLLANPVAYWCGYMNSACNPIIYALRSPSFRQGYKEIICSQATYALGASTITRPSLSPFPSLHGKSRKRLSDPIQSRLLTSPTKSSARGLHVRMRRINYSSFPSLQLRCLAKDRSKSLVVSHSDRNITKNNGSKCFDLGSFLRASVNGDLNVSQHEHLNKNGIFRRAISAPSVIETSNKQEVHHAEHNFVFSKEHKVQGISSSKSESNINSCHRGIKSTKTAEIVDEIGKSSPQSPNVEDSSYYQKTNNPVVVVDDPSPMSSNEFCRNGYSSSPHSDVELGVSHHFAPLNCLGRSCSDQVRSEDPWDIPTQHSGQWSPASIKSLEMSRNLRRNSKNKAKITELAPLTTKNSEEPESPLYSASREQLMKWMSQDKLDRIETIERDLEERFCMTKKIASSR